MTDLEERVARAIRGCLSIDNWDDLVWALKLASKAEEWPYMDEWDRTYWRVPAVINLRKRKGSSR